MTVVVTAVFTPKEGAFSEVATARSPAIRGPVGRRQHSGGPRSCSVGWSHHTAGQQRRCGLPRPVPGTDPGPIRLIAALIMASLCPGTSNLIEAPPSPSGHDGNQTLPSGGEHLLLFERVGFSKRLPAAERPVIVWTALAQGQVENRTLLHVPAPFRIMSTHRGFQGRLGLRQSPPTLESPSRKMFHGMGV